MVNYSDGKIYKIEAIVEHPQEDINIGSTTKKYLSQRMDNHRRCYNCWKNGKYNKNYVFDLFDKYGVDKCTILLLESVNANNKDELRAKEGHYIRALKCANKRIENRTQQEYYQDNKDKISQYQKEYYDGNKDKISQYQKEYYDGNKEKINQICICNICNCNYIRRCKSQHENSKKHQSNLKQKNPN